MLSENLPLANINRSETDVHKLLDTEAHVLLDPAKVILVVILGKASQEGNRHAVDVTAVASLRGVDIGMRIDPDNSNIAVETLAGSLGGTGDGANGDTVVTTESEGHTALGGVLVGLLGDLAGDDGGVTGLLHAAVVGVGLGDDVLEGLDTLIAVDLVAEFLADLVEETRLEEDLGASIDTSFGLSEVMSAYQV